MMNKGTGILSHFLKIELSSLLDFEEKMGFLVAIEKL